MSTDERPVETLFRERAEVRAGLERIETIKRQLRLGRGLGQERRTGLLVMLKGVYGGGWLSAVRNEPVRLGGDTTAEFYAFLSAKQDELAEQYRAIDQRLAEVQVPEATP